MDLNTYLTQNNISGAQFAKTLGVPQSLISDWRSGARPTPVKQCVLIEKATKGKVTRKDLRPDDWHLIWPELQKGRAA